MKVAISYPPLPSAKGVPLLAQNRQFQWFSSPTYIYPVVPAYAATLLRHSGFEVFWDDAIAEELSYARWWRRLLSQRPQIVVLESKTPVIQRHWRIIDELKTAYPDLITVLVGDHVSALPAESLRRSRVDWVLTGGDHDSALLALCRHLDGGGGVAGAPPPAGAWWREGGQLRGSGPCRLDSDLDQLPWIDRELTRWRLYSERNGNFKHRPGTYVMAGRDCWWGRCSFCSWTTLYPGEHYRTVSVERHLDEIGALLDRYPLREIFDDSGCFPRGDWLRRFCEGMIARGYHRRVTLGCNMRVGALTADEWRRMKAAGFRFVLIGLESVSQATLERLHKGIRVEQIEETCRLASRAGLEPHITVMMGYPWETRQDAEATVALARRLFARGYIDSLQATIVVPYPGTPMFDQARQRGWLLTEDWERYDMRGSVWRSDVGEADVKRYAREMYKAALTPRFLARKLVRVRSFDDLGFLLRAGQKLLGHLSDFGHGHG